MLHCSDRCRNAVPNLPMVAFRRPKNLRDYLVHAKLKNRLNRLNRLREEQLNVITEDVIGDELFSFVSRWSHFTASHHQAMRSIVYVLLFVARWFAVIGAFRCSLISWSLVDVLS